MNKIHTPHKPTATPEKAEPDGRIFKFSFKSIPVVDTAMEARLKAAALTTRKDRRYPVMIESSDT